jgi:hypothetical protein
MFWFYIWVKQKSYPTIRWYWWEYSWITRNCFIEKWVDVLVKEVLHSTDWYNTQVKYSEIKQALNKVRCIEYWTNRDWVKSAIKEAKKKYGEENLYCVFT